MAQGRGEGGGLFLQTCFLLLLREGVAKVPCHTSCPYALYTCCQNKQAAQWLAPQGAGKELAAVTAAPWPAR